MDIAPLLPYIKDKVVQLYLGDEYEELAFVDNTKKVWGCVYGSCKDLIGHFLVLNCFYVDKEGEIAKNNIVYINVWQIKAITRIDDGTGSLSDVLLSAGHINKVKEKIDA